MASAAEEIEKVETWIEQVENEDIDSEDYDLPEHDGKGLKGLANVTAYLAVYQDENGNYRADEEVIESAERPQKLRNIVYGNRREDDKGLLEKEQGRDFVRELLEEFKQEAAYEENDTPKPENRDEEKHGGEKMTNDRIDHQKRTTHGAKEQHEEATRELHQNIEDAVDALDQVDELEDERDKIEDEYVKHLRDLQSYLDQHREVVEDLGYDAERVENRLDNIDLHGTPSDVGLSDNLRDPDFTY
ncbi:MAG: hypothetical protein ABEJ64_04185 [Candidatus Nanohaloarchaea archaeon]